MRTIEIVVDPKGNSRVETKGFTGGSCREASRFIEEALGRTSAEQLTPAFYTTHTQEQSNRQGQ